MSELLLELLSDEIPARMQAKAREDLARMLLEALEKNTLSVGAYKTYVTPRRLTIHLTGMAAATFASEELRRGPRIDAPEKAIDGFLKSTGLSRDQLIQQDEGKGTFFFAKISTASRAAADVITDVVPAIIRAFPWPKSMRFGAASTNMDALRWVRPLHSILCVLDGKVVPFDVDGIVSGNSTVGHRFMTSKTPTPLEGDGRGVITPNLAPTSTTAAPPPPKGRSPSPSRGGGVLIEPVSSFADYQQKLLEHHVILNGETRAERIWAQATALASAAGLSVVEDKGLLEENAGLTEWPVPLLGTFDAAFLDVPPEVIQLTMRTNQKYFALRDKTGKLSNHFICVANIAASDGGATIVAGNQRVLAARLSDAKFFWEQDKRQPLENYLQKLNSVVFHEKIGSVGEKVSRVVELAERIARTVYNDNNIVDQSVRAAQLCKADLVTGMVGEFPELQGVMGGYYARAQGESDAVADAIRNHYKPQGPSDTCPTAPVSIALALADKLDTLQSFFNVGITPTGSGDPFALRRAALGYIRLQIENGLTNDLAILLDDAKAFVLERFGIYMRDQGLRADVIAAVIAEPVSYTILKERAHSLQRFLDELSGQQLLAGYKRAINIWSIERARDNQDYFADWGDLSSGGAEEQALRQALDRAHQYLKNNAGTQFSHIGYHQALSTLANLQSHIDVFFTATLINDADPDVRASRLRLLAGIRDVFELVADFRKIDK